MKRIPPPSLSIPLRLKALAKEQGDDTQRLINRYAIERFLYRLSMSPYAGQFVLKGGNLFVIWQNGRNLRATRDTDLLCRGNAEKDYLLAAFSCICDMPVDVDDGVSFDAASIKIEDIRALSQYGGFRITLKGRLGKAVPTLRFDIGIGDSIIPGIETDYYPALLPDIPMPHLLVYSYYTATAEKLQAMVSIGMTNSRVKDFFDIWQLARIREFEYGTLRKTVLATFERRKTPLPVRQPVCFSPAFVELAEKYWQALLIDNDLLQTDCPQKLSDAVEVISAFLMPVIANRLPESARWIPSSGWIHCPCN